MEEKRVGYRIVGTIKETRGECGAGHKIGDHFELSARVADGLCGFFYNGTFPYIVMLQFGGAFPLDWGNPDVIEMDCMDKINAVTIELKRMKE